MRTEFDINRAIKHAKNMAEDYGTLGDVYSVADHEKAKEFRQLAEWLRELKAYREVEEIIKGICKDRCEFPDDVPVMCGACWVGTVIEIFDNLLDDFRGGDEDDLRNNFK